MKVLLKMMKTESKCLKKEKKKKRHWREMLQSDLTNSLELFQSQENPIESNISRFAIQA